MSDNQLLSLLVKTETKSAYMYCNRILILIIASVIICSCTGKVEKPSSSGIIPERDLIPILMEIHIADGMLANPKILNWVLNVDSISTYNYIATKHGYSKAALDNTMHYYFIRKPKKLIRIYDKVLAKLSEMESLLDKEVMIAREHSTDIWPGEKYYYFPDSSGSRSLEFAVSLAGNRVYSLNFTAIVFPDDQSVNPGARVFSFDADSVNTGKRSYFETLAFIKDGRPHIYSIRIFVASAKTIILKGTLYDIDNHLEEWQKHISFENITLSIPSADI
jgi:hypothetical protein